MIAGAMLRAQPEHLRPEIERRLRAGAVSLALLARFEFAGGAARLCNWSVPVTDGRDGLEWLPLRARVGWRDVEGGERNLAPLRIYYMTVPVSIARAFAADPGPFPDLSDKSEYQGRAAELALQLMGTAAPDTGRARPLGYPNVLHAGVMDRIKVKVGREEVVHELHVEGVLARKRVPGNGLLTPRDQKARHPGDLGLDYVTEIPVRPARWPNY